MPYIILCESPDGAVSVYAESDDDPTTAIVFPTKSDVRKAIEESVLLQGLPIQRVKLKMKYGGE
jgi:hypothetical protein